MMSFLIQCGLMIAQQEGPSIPPAWGRRAQEVFKGWDNTTEMFPVRSLGYILAGVLLVLAILVIRQWYQNRPADPKSSTIFRRLAGELHLGLRDQWLLVRIARHQKLPSAITLLLNRKTFAYHAKAYIADLAEIRRPGVAQAVENLMKRVFGSEADEQAQLQAILTASDFKLPTAEELAQANIGTQFITQPARDRDKDDAPVAESVASPAPAAG